MIIFSTKQVNTYLSISLNKNINTLMAIFGNSSDIIVREFCIGLTNKVNACIIFANGLVEKKLINEDIMKSIILDVRIAETPLLNAKKDLFTIIKNVLPVSELLNVKTFEEVIDGVLSGETVLLIDGYAAALRISSQGWKNRGIKEPDTEAVVRGPREGFTETLQTNIALLRRKFKSPDLTFETIKIGTYTKTNVCIVYIRGIVNNKIVEELKKRLARINIDGILESGYIEQFIEDTPLSLFPTIGYTEKPDIAAAKLLEGRVAIITDGTPVVLTLPYLFIESLQGADDYYGKPWYSSVIRWIRIMALIGTIFLPGLFVAIQTYHSELIPTPLLITVVAAREGVPFPAFIEVASMGIIFEVLREAGIRMPRPIGQAVSIVGSLVLGEAAVNAGLVSNPAVMLTALVGISSFIIPSLNSATAILRLIFLVLAAGAGLFGILIGTFLLLVHIMSLRSFGAPYLAPIVPLNIEGLKDSVIKAPLWATPKRPSMITRKNTIRLNPNSKPKPPKNN